MRKHIITRSLNLIRRSLHNVFLFIFSYWHKFYHSYRSEGIIIALARVREVITESFNPLVFFKYISIKSQYRSFNPYVTLTSLKPIEVIAVDKQLKYTASHIQFSLITTIRNEGDNIVNFLKSIEEQTLIPSEIVIVDGGSTDDTATNIETYAQNSKLNIIFMKGQRLNIAQGRNLAIKSASHEILVLTDAGCSLDRDFVKNIVGLFFERDDIDLAGGIYFPKIKNQYSMPFVPLWDLIDWQDFLPSARAIAIRKTLAQKIGGFPEELTLTGEDTLFDVNYRRVSRKWIFNNAAFVHWHSPRTRQDMLALAYRYGLGDGESGLGDFRFYNLYKLHAHGQYKSRKTFLSSYFDGFMKGRENRSVIEIEKKNINGLLVILSGVPITDSGGGQRGAQIALEYTRNNYKVIYVNVYPSFEEKHCIFFDIDYTLIELYLVDDFNISEVTKRYLSLNNDFLIMLEFPHPRFIPIIDYAKDTRSDVKIIYDYIDNWNSTLGWEWYSAETENIIMNKADLLLASACTLQNDLQSRTSKAVHLVPNAVNQNIFDPSLKFDRPIDLPVSDHIVLYLGAMWGEWFDWELLEYTAKSLPDHTIVLIGNIAKNRKTTLESRHSNVKFLGLKPQKDLPAYIHHSSVCIIPFKRDHITKYVNPLKIYEYLAMLKPVVTTEMEELKNIPSITMCSTSESFVEAIMNSELNKSDHDFIKTFIAKNSWRERASAIRHLVSSIRKDTETGLYQNL